MRTEELIDKAKEAVPTWEKGKPGPGGKWAPIWPVYRELRRKGFTIKEAVDWMIREGVVKESDRQAAEWGLPMVDSRRKREEKAAKAARGEG